MMNLMHLEGCIHETPKDEFLDMTLLRKRIKEGDISVDIFN